MTHIILGRGGMRRRRLAAPTELSEGPRDLATLETGIVKEESIFVELKHGC